MGSSVSRSEIPAGSASGADPLEQDAGADAAATMPVAASRADWESAAPRVMQYLRAIGVRDPHHLVRLSARVRARFERRVATSLVADATEVGIEETVTLLDEWLAVELGPDASESMIRMARAAVLGGSVKGWIGTWSGDDPEPAGQPVGQPIGERILASCLAPVPDAAPLSMVKQRIDPCCRRLMRRLTKLLRGMRSGSLRRRVSLGQST